MAQQAQAGAQQVASIQANAAAKQAAQQQQANQRLLQQQQMFQQRQAQMTQQAPKPTLGERAQNLQRSGYYAVAAGASLTATVTAPVVGLAAKDLTVAAGYQDQIQKVAALTNVARNQIGGLNAAVLQLSKDPLVRQGPTELAKGLYFVTSVIDNASDAMKVLRTSAIGASAGLGKTEQVANIVTGAMDAFHISADNSVKITDALTQAVKDGKAEAPDFAGALSKVSSSASLAGVSLNETLASMATMTRLSISAGEAGTSLNQVLLKLINPTDAVKKKFAEIGTSVEEVRNNLKTNGLADELNRILKLARAHGGESEIFELFPNVRALKGVLATAGVQADNYARTLEHINAASGTAANAAATASETFNFQLDKLKSTAEAVAISLGTKFLPQATAITQKLGQDIPHAVDMTVAAWNSLPEPLQKALIGLTAVVAMAGPVSMLAGNVMILISTLMRVPAAITWMAANPVVLAAMVVAVGAAATAYEMLRAKMDDAAVAAHNLEVNANNMGKAFDSALSVTSGNAKATKVVEDLQAKVKAAGDDVPKLGSAIKQLTDAKREVKDLHLSPAAQQAFLADIDKLIRAAETRQVQLNVTPDTEDFWTVLGKSAPDMLKNAVAGPFSGYNIVSSIVDSFSYAPPQPGTSASSPAPTGPTFFGPPAPTDAQRLDSEHIRITKANYKELSAILDTYNAKATAATALGRTLSSQELSNFTQAKKRRDQMDADAKAAKAKGTTTSGTTGPTPEEIARQKDALGDAATAWDAYAHSVEQAADRQIRKIQELSEQITSFVQGMERHLSALGALNSNFYVKEGMLGRALPLNQAQLAIWDTSRSQANAARQKAVGFRQQGEALNGQDQVVPNGYGGGNVPTVNGRPGYEEWMWEHIGQRIGKDCYASIQAGFNASGIKASLGAVGRNPHNQVGPNAAGDYPEGTIGHINPGARGPGKSGHWYTITGGHFVLDSNWQLNSQNGGAAVGQPRLLTRSMINATSMFTLPPGVKAVYPGGGSVAPMAIAHDATGKATLASPSMPQGNFKIAAQQEGRPEPQPYNYYAAGMAGNVLKETPYNQYRRQASEMINSAQMNNQLPQLLEQLTKQFPKLKGMSLDAGKALIMSMARTTDYADAVHNASKETQEFTRSKQIEIKVQQASSAAIAKYGADSVLATRATEIAKYTAEQWNEQTIKGRYAMDQETKSFTANKEVKGRVAAFTHALIGQEKAEADAAVRAVNLQIRGENDKQAIIKQTLPLLASATDSLYEYERAAFAVQKRFEIWRSSDVVKAFQDEKAGLTPKGSANKLAQGLFNASMGTFDAERGQKAADYDAAATRQFNGEFGASVAQKNYLTQSGGAGTAQVTENLQAIADYETKLAELRDQYGEADAKRMAKNYMIRQGLIREIQRQIDLQKELAQLPLDTADTNAQTALLLQVGSLTPAARNQMEMQRWMQQMHKEGKDSEPGFIALQSDKQKDLDAQSRLDSVGQYTSRLQELRKEMYTLGDETGMAAVRFDLFQGALSNLTPIEKMNYQLAESSAFMQRFSSDAEKSARDATLSAQHDIASQMQDINRRSGGSPGRDRLQLDFEYEARRRAQHGLPGFSDAEKTEQQKQLDLAATRDRIERFQDEANRYRDIIGGALRDGFDKGIGAGIGSFSRGILRMIEDKQIERLSDKITNTIMGGKRKKLEGSTPNSTVNAGWILGNLPTGGLSLPAFASSSRHDGTKAGGVLESVLGGGTPLSNATFRITNANMQAVNVNVNGGAGSGLSAIAPLFGGGSGSSPSSSQAVDSIVAPIASSGSVLV